MSKPTDITELRDQLIDAFEAVQKGPRRAAQVKEMTNAAGKIILTLRTQIEYAMLRAEEPDILFMGKGSGKPLKTAPAQVKLLSGNVT